MLASRLRFGDKIGIIAPSNPITEDLMGDFLRGVNFIEEMGFEVELGHNIYANSLAYSAKPEEKAADIHQMFRNPGIKAILCAQGGNTSNSCLPLLDWNLIKNNPKIFLGISDISVLLNAIYQKAGLITYHGNDVIWGFGKSPAEYEKSVFINRFVQGTKDIKESPANNRLTIIAGEAEGRLLGGNLRCFLKLTGTEYFPQVDKFILFIEGMLNSLDRADSLLTQLQQIGLLERAQGIILGHIEGLDNLPERQGSFEEVLLRKLNRRIPVLKTFDFGHNCPNTILPVGAIVSFNTDKKEILIRENLLNE
ncbi:MAG: LD-carboxypeptidase [Halanaerobium sp.]|nr:LD-carboxypeptidase [Halanaerobium sp.]